MDIVYILGTGSHWQNNEIRYSLRSVERYAKGLRNIYVIGILPEFLTGVIHMPCDDIQWKQKSIAHKVTAACNNADISDNFLFINDDHFFLRPVDIRAFPYYHKGELQKAIEKLTDYNMYCRCLSQTLKALQVKKLATNNFDCHCPIIYNKKTMQQVIAAYDWSGPNGYVLKSLYANTAGIDGEYLPDLNICVPLNKERIYDQFINDRTHFSIGETPRFRKPNDALQQVLNELYPIPSRWER